VRERIGAISWQIRRRHTFKAQTPPQKEAQQQGRRIKKKKTIQYNTKSILSFSSLFFFYAHTLILSIH
jgi:hypothetical protein